MLIHEGVAHSILYALLNGLAVPIYTPSRFEEAEKDNIQN